jgi:hypothetical protein
MRSFCGGITQAGPAIETSLLLPFIDAAIGMLDRAIVCGWRGGARRCSAGRATQAMLKGCLLNGPSSNIELVSKLPKLN